MVRARGTRERTVVKTGFTLFEILVALVVMSVAISGIIWCYLASADLAKRNRIEKVAGAFAQELLTDLVNNPGRYVWTFPADSALGEVASLEGQGTALVPPSTLPPEPSRSHRREAGFYEVFSWKAFAKLPAPEANYVEVTVQVTWVKSPDAEGKHKDVAASFALTSCVPRFAVESKG